MGKLIKSIRLIPAVWILLFVILCFGNLSLRAQHPILEQVQKARQKGVDFRTYSLFTYQGELKNLLPLRTELPKGAALTINPVALKTLHQQRPNALSLRLPKDENGQIFQVDLIKIDLYTPDFKLNTSKDGYMSYDSGVHYRGVLRGKANTSVALSFFKDEVMGVIGFSESSNWALGRMQSSKSRDTYILYQEDDLPIDKSFSCGSGEISQEIRKVEHNLGDLRGVNAVDKTVRVYFECEYDLVLEKGGAAGAANFISGIFNVVSLLYQNEGINTVISEIFAWTSADTYPTTSTSAILGAFRSARSTFNGNLAHLVSRGSPANGGIAYVPGLCNGYGYAYSYVNSTYSEFPTYSWTVNVITHEMGHNLGSPHTHDCAWNGNNTPLDGCGPAAGYAGTGSCTPLAAPIAPFKGTIMSYCHLLGNIGMDLTQGFGPQPGDRIRATVSAATCLSGAAVCNAPTSTQLSTSNIAANSVTLACTSSGVVSFDWRYRLVGASTWTDLANTTASSINLSALVAGSNYEFQASVQCTSGGTWSAWSPAKAFTTLAITCNAPTELQISSSNIGASTATLNCTLSGVVSYDWRYRLVGASTWTDLANSTASSINLSALVAGSNYEFQASVQCTSGGTWSAWSPAKAFTTYGCATPLLSQISATNVTTTTATLNCSLIGVVSYDWRYRRVGISSWTNLPNTTSPNMSISGLVPDRTYEFQVTVQCTAGGAWQPWSVSQTLITSGTTCNGPSSTQLASSNVTASTASLTCTLGGVAGYDWRYRLVGASTWIDLTNTTANSVNLSALTAASNYEFQSSVQCTAGGVWSTWSASKTFTTLTGTCNPPTVAQLSTSNLGTSTATLNCSLTGVVSYDWRYRFVGASTWIDLTNTTANSVNLSALTAASNYEFQSSVQCTAGGVWSTWSASKTFTTLTGTCNPPTVAQLSTSNLGTSTATLNCSLTGVVSYDWRYRLVGASTWIDLTNTTANSVNLSALTAASNYEFQSSVQCTAGGSWSTWSSSQNFTTISTQACGQPNINQLTATLLSSTSAQLTCLIPGAQPYSWQYRRQGISSWTNLLNNSTPNVTITGLLPGRIYEYRARVTCSGLITAWSNTTTFSTPSSLIGGPEEAGLSPLTENVQLTDLWLYPNPARTELNVSYYLNTNSDLVDIQVFDLTGRKIQQHHLGAQPTGAHQYQIQTDFNPGMFFIRIKAGKSSLMKRFTVVKR